MMSTKAQELVALLRAVAWEHVHRQNYAVVPSQVSVFIPQNLLASVLGVNPLSIRRWFWKYRDLRELVAFKQHFTSLRTASGTSRVVKDGSVWSIRLRGPSGRAVRVPYEDLKKQYRSLEKDIQTGWTNPTTECLYGSKDFDTKTLDDQVQVILRWFDHLQVHSPFYRSVQGMEDAFSAADPELIADTLATSLQDLHSRDFWFKTACHWARNGRLSTLYGLAKRVLTDKNENAARNPGALLVWRLKTEAPLFNAR